MNFIKTQKMLTQQADQKEIPLESVLELMRTYLTELRYHTNTSVDRCRIGNMSQLVASLAAVSNDILFVYRTNEKEILATENRFTQALIKAQTACGDYHSRITLLDEQIRQSEAVLTHLEELQSQEASRNAALSDLRQKSEDLQARIDALRVTNPETEAGKLKALLEAQNRELAQAQEEHRRLQQDQEQVRKQLEAENAQLTQLRSTVNSDRTRLKEIGQDIQDHQDIHKELEQEYCRLDHRLVTLKTSNDDLVQAQYDLREKIGEAQAALDKQQEQYDRRHDALTTRSSQLEALKAQCAQDAAAAQELDNQYAALEKEQANLQEQITSRQEEIRRIKEEGGQLLDQLNALIGMQSKIRMDYEDACGLHRERQQALDALTRQLEQETQESAAAAEALEARNTELAQVTAAHQEKSVQLQALNTQIGKLEGEIRQLQEDASRRRTEIAAAEDTLKAEQTDFDRLLEQQVTLSVDLEAQKTANQTFIADHLDPLKAQMTELVLQARKAQEQKDELKDSIQQLTEKYTELVKNNHFQLAALSSWQLKLDKIQAEFEKNQQAVAVLTADFNIKSTESAALLAREKELRELLDEKNVARITAELESCNKRLEEDIRRAEKTEADLAEAQHRLQTCQEQLSLVQDELADCRSRESQLLQRHKTVSQELDRISCPENRQRCEQLHNQLQLMQAMCDRLTQRIPMTCGEVFEIPEQLQEHLDQSEQTIATLRHVIREYTALRQNILENRA